MVAHQLLVPAVTHGIQPSGRWSDGCSPDSLAATRCINRSDRVERSRGPRAELANEQFDTRSPQVSTAARCCRSLLDPSSGRATRCVGRSARAVGHLWGTNLSGRFSDSRNEVSEHLRSTIAGVGGIGDKAWLTSQLDRGVPIRRIALVAGVSRPTVYAWIERHEIIRTPDTRVRPSPVELALAYDRCRTTRELGERFDVSPETARRWLIAAGIARRRARVDVEELRRKRAAGATVAQLATEYRVGNDTVRRRLDPSWDQ
jgi:transposase-like protein